MEIWPHPQPNDWGTDLSTHTHHHQRFAPATICSQTSEMQEPPPVPASSEGLNT